MRWDQLASEPCSLARALAIVGDRWTLLILRDAFLKVRRFDDFHARLGIARRILAARLTALVDAGILDRQPYQARPVRHEYRLTQKGLELYPVLLSLVHWGDRHCADADGPPMLHRHKACGHDFRGVLTCSECGEAVEPRAVEPRPAAGANPR